MSETPKNNPEPGAERAPLESSLDPSPYTIYSRTEIVYILRTLARKGSLVTVHFDRGRHFILSAVLTAGAEIGVVFDYGSEEALNERLLSADRLIFVASQDKVRVQFATRAAERVRYQGRDAFRVALPESLIKLQRRGDYRIETPVVNPVVCLIPHPDGRRIALPLADLSIGGAALIDWPDELQHASGTLLPDCRIAFPEAGMIVGTLQVRYCQDLVTKAGKPQRRCGCQFMDLPRHMQVVIQRYIITLDRERRAKSVDDD